MIGARKRSLYLAGLRIQNYSLKSIGIYEYVESWVRSRSCDRSNENSSRIPHSGLNFAASSTSTTTTTMPVRFHYRPASISTRLLSRHAPFPPPPSYARRPRCTYAREKTTSAAALKYARRRLARVRGTHALLLHWISDSVFIVVPEKYVLMWIKDGGSGEEILNFLVNWSGWNDVWRLLRIDPFVLWGFGGWIISEVFFYRIPRNDGLNVKFTRAEFMRDEEEYKLGWWFLNISVLYKRMRMNVWFRK